MTSRCSIYLYIAPFRKNSWVKRFFIEKSRFGIACIRVIKLQVSEKHGRGGIRFMLSDSQNRKSKRLESCVLVGGSNNVYLNGRLRSPLHKRSNMSPRRMRRAAIENEVAEYLERYRHVTDNKRHRFAVHNGYLPERKVLSGVDHYL